MKLLLGDCLDKLKELEDNSIDSIVTDPPYGLSFMGKKWDYDVPKKKIWKECMRVLKPGGYLLAFAGSRTYHRMAIRIENAGFEIRDQMMWIYGSGFPKSMDISKQIDKKGGTIGKNIVLLKQKLIELADKCGKTRKNIDMECGFRATNYLTLPKEGKKPDPWVSILPSDEKWYKIKEVLGIGNEFDDIFTSSKREVIGIQTKARSENSSFTMPTMGDETEYKSWDITTPATDEAKNWEGWGTALKPAHEPIVMARKPFSGTVADNVIEWGTGGINVDGSRIPTDETITNHIRSAESAVSKGKYGDSSEQETHQTEGQKLGRFPANIIFDEEAGKLLDEQYEGVSRFFYCPKTSKAERNEGTNNNHPTVKPTDLMLYLIRLVTPKDGTTLDPFMGSGSTGKAAVRGGFDFIGIEREDEYFQIAESRINYEINKPTKITKSKEEVSKEVVNKLNQFFV
jgi:DNA modification methylase